MSGFRRSPALPFILGALAAAAIALAGCAAPEPSAGPAPTGWVAPPSTSELDGTTTTTAEAPGPGRQTLDGPPAAPRPAPRGEQTTVGSITDGDTLRTAEGTRVRLIGVDTPERSDCGYREAGAHLAALVPVGATIGLVHDAQRTDRYGRTLAYVFRSSDGLFVNRAMAADGFAKQMTVPPNVAHAEDFASAVADARGANRGLWSLCADSPSPAPPTRPSPPPTGSSPPPRSAPAPSDDRCHRSYEGTCIPPDVSDADCAGGSGNGPWYVQERNIRVVGPDVFDLDRDGDGIGCES